MLTRNDLSAIKKVVREEVQGVEEKLQGVEEKLTAKINGVEENLTDRINGVDKKLSMQIKGVDEKLSRKMEKVQETIDIVQNVVVKHYGKLDQRVAAIEEELRNPPINLPVA